MKRITISLLMAVLTVMTVAARTLIVAYSFTGNVSRIVSDLQAQTAADVVRIEPATEGLDYAANNYAIGSALMSAIRSNPGSAASYPDIKPVDVNLAAYDMIIIATPLWWSGMAAPMQTFLFHHGALMSGKRIALIVSSASSGTSGVEADARRLVPGGSFVSPCLWIRSSQTTNCHAMISEWLEQTGYSGATSVIAQAADAPVRISATADAIRIEGGCDRLSLFSPAGQKLLETTARVVDTSSLPAGAYVVQVSAGAQTVRQKILVP